MSNLYALPESQHKLFICFIAGSGGHFIASICEYLLFGLVYFSEENGSYHNLKKFFRAPGILPRDNTLESYISEYQYIISLNEQQLVVGHVRNLALLQELGWKVIYIDFDHDDIEEIDNRLAKKIELQKIETITQDQYNLLKGISWPTWDDYKKGVPAPELDDRYVRLKGHRECITWAYNMPSIKKNICQIEFKEILNGYTIIEKLSAFLNINDFDKSQLEQKINEYRSKQ